MPVIAVLWFDGYDSTDSAKLYGKRSSTAATVKPAKGRTRLLLVVLIPPWPCAAV